MSEQTKQLAIEMMLTDLRRDVYEGADESGKGSSGHFFLTYSGGRSPVLSGSDVRELVQAGWLKPGSLEAGYKRGPKLAEPKGEGRCERCGGPNIVWFAPSELWNKYSSGHDIICPICFARLAESQGLLPTAWVLSPEVIAADK